MAKKPEIETTNRLMTETFDITVRSSRYFSKGREVRARDYQRTLYDGNPDYVPPPPNKATIIAVKATAAEGLGTEPTAQFEYAVDLASAALIAESVTLQLFPIDPTVTPEDFGLLPSAPFPKAMLPIEPGQTRSLSLKFTSITDLLDELNERFEIRAVEASAGVDITTTAPVAGVITDTTPTPVPEPPPSTEPVLIAAWVSECTFVKIADGLRVTHGADAWVVPEGRSATFNGPKTKTYAEMLARVVVPTPSPDPAPEPPPPGPGPDPTPAPSSALRGVVTIGGMETTLRPAEMTYLGRCEPDPALTHLAGTWAEVWEKRLGDTVVLLQNTSQRPEIHICHGRSTATGRANLGGHRVQLFDDAAGTLLFDVTATRCNYFGGWRYPNTMWPVKITPAELLARKLVPKYAANGLTLAGPAASSTPYTPMGNAWYTLYMPSTGGRRELAAWFSGPEAEYLITGNKFALADIQSGAEAFYSMPMHITDDKVFAPVDLIKNPGWGFGGEQPTKIAGASTEWTLDTAHAPPPPLLAYLLTGDPTYLRQVQFWANLVRGSYGSHAGSGILATMPWGEIGQTRAYYRTLRALFMALQATPETVPSWLLPKSYWRQAVDANIAFMKSTFMTELATSDQYWGRATIGTPAPMWYIPAEPGIAQGCGFAPWQDCEGAALMECGLQIGMTDLAPIAEWTRRIPLALTQASGGWNRNRGCTYRIKLRNDTNERIRTSWAEIDALNIGPNGNPTSFQVGDGSYQNDLTMALMAAMRNGVDTAERCDFMVRSLKADGWACDYRQQLAA